MCAHSGATGISDSAVRLGQICTLLLQSQRRSCVQEASTFSRLLCVNKQLHDILLHAAVGCIRADVPKYHSSAQADRCLVRFLVRHMNLGTIKCLQLDADDFSPDLYLQLVQHMHPTFAAHASTCEQLRPRVHEHLREAAQWNVPQTPAAAQHVDQPSMVHSMPASGADAPRCKPPTVLVSWHVCGLPPSGLYLFPGATITHLTLRSSTLTPVTARALADLKTLQQLHLPNLNPEPGSLAPALAALTAVTQLFIRHPCQPEQQALPLALQELIVSQRTPPWVDPVPALMPLRISHLTALHTLMIQEWFAQGITEDFRLPCSLEHLAVACVTAAAPLLSLRNLRTLQLSSLRHSCPHQLLQLSSLPSLNALQLGSGESAAAARLSYDDLRSYAAVFAALPVAVTSLTVQQRVQSHIQHVCLCQISLSALAHLTSLKSLSLHGCAIHRPYCDMQHCHTAAAPSDLAAALSALSALTQLQLSQLPLAGTDIKALACQTDAHNTSACREDQPAHTDGSLTAPEEVTLEVTQHESATVSSSTCPSSVSQQPSEQACVASEGAHQGTSVTSAVTGQECVTGNSTDHCRAWCQVDWRPALQSIAKLRSLRKLACRGLPLRAAAEALAAAVGLQQLALYDCEVPQHVVDALIQHLSGGPSTSDGVQQAAVCIRAGSACCAEGCLTCLRFSTY